MGTGNKATEGTGTDDKIPKDAARLIISEPFFVRELDWCSANPSVGRCEEVDTEKNELDRRDRLSWRCDAGDSRPRRGIALELEAVEARTTPPGISVLRREPAGLDAVADSRILSFACRFSTAMGTWN